MPSFSDQISALSILGHVEEISKLYFVHFSEALFDLFQLLVLLVFLGRCEVLYVIGFWYALLGDFGSLGSGGAVVVRVTEGYTVSWKVGSHVESGVGSSVGIRLVEGCGSCVGSSAVETSVKVVDWLRMKGLVWSVLDSMEDITDSLYVLVATSSPFVVVGVVHARQTCGEVM